MREDKTYFEYANEAAAKTRKISQLLCGMDIVKSGGMEYGLVLHDVNNVLEQLHNAGGCDGSTEYARGWDDAMEEAERIVAAGLSLKANAGWNEPD